MTAKVEIEIPNNWAPREYQLPFWRYLQNGGLRAVAVAHRRWGKDDVALHWTCCSILKKPATYWHMLPAYSQARKAIWTAVNPHTGVRRIDEAFPLCLRANTNEQEMFIRFKNGATWQVVGSDNYNSLVGSPPYGLCFSEFSLADPSSWAYLAPILAENGGWAIFIYTARGRNHGYSLYRQAVSDDGWFATLQTAEETGVFSELALKAELANYQGIYGEDEGEALYNQEYHCSFDSAILGAYYGKAMTKAEQNGQITRIPYDPTMPVHTSWDLGLHDATVVWFFQQTRFEVRFIDYYEVNNQGLIDTAKHILNNKPYNYGMHYMPHDIAVRVQTTNQPRIESVRAAGLRSINVGVSYPGSLADGINAVRNIIPKCVWDEKNCARGLDALRQYRRVWDTAKRIYLPIPFRDWTTHGCDAFREMAMSILPERLEIEEEEDEQMNSTGRNSATGY